jgi:hypothetical protein
MAGNSLCPNETLENPGRYCADCVYEREDQFSLYFSGKINVRELLIACQCLPG